MKRKFVFLLISMFLTSLAFSADFTVDLTDDYGDGWNGGELDVTVDGTLVLDGITISYGAGPETHTFAVEDGDLVELNYSAGSYSYENAYYVYDNVGALVASSGDGGVEPDAHVEFTADVITISVEDPASFTATTNGIDQIDLAWTQNASGDDVMVAWSADGTFGDPASGTTYAAGDPITGGGTVLYNGSNTSFNHTGLDDGTTYYYKAWSTANVPVREIQYSLGITDDATTEVEPITTFPWTEDFEGTFLPTGWSKIVHSGNDITQSATQNHTSEGLYSARFSSYSNASDYNQYLFTTPITIDGSYTQLSFWHRKYNTSSELLEWGIATDTDPASYTWTSVTLSDTEWQETVVDLSSYIGQTVYIGFHYFGDYLYYVYLDDVSIEEIPTSPEFEVDPTSYDFGTVNLGTTSTAQTFTISNIGGGTLTITDVSLTGTDIDQFVLTDGNSYPHDLGAGEAITVDVAFAPNSEGAKTANLTINDNRATTDVPLSGSGYDATVTTFPWSEDFTDSSTPTDWVNDGTESWLFSTNAGYGAAPAGDHTTGGGTNYAWIDGSGGISDNQLVTPPLDPATLTEPILSFWYFSNNTNAPGDNNTLYCDMNIDGGGWARATIFTYSGDSSEWQNEIIDLSGYSYTNNIQFRFWVEETTTGSAYYNDILIDDVEVKEAPAVLPPANLSTTDIGIVHATFNWDAASGATYYEVRWGLDGFDVETGPYNDATEISGTSIEVSELTPDTAYDWYVRGDDGMGRATSDWSSVASFTTHDGVAANPTPADGAGNIAITSTTLDWDDIYDASEYFITIGTTSGGNDVVDSVSTGTNSEYTYGSDWSNSTTYYWTVYTEYDDNMGRGGMKERASSRGFQVVTGDEWQFTTTFEAVTNYPYFIDFETGAMPGGWTEIYEIGTHSWNYQNGGYSANPSNAYKGFYNAAYTHENTDDITKLVTRPLDLSSVSNPQLEFVHAQLEWAGDQDELRVYYRTSSGGSWNLLAEYTTSLDWTTRMISLPNPSADYYLAFEATDGYGYGVCLDDVKVYGGESNSQPPAPGGTAYNYDGGSSAGGSTVTLDPTTAGGDVTITQYDDPPGTLPFPENALDLWFDIDGSSFSGDFPVDVTIEWDAPAPVGTSSPVLLVSLDGSSWTNVLDDAGVTDVIWDLEAPAPYSVSFTTDHFSMWALGNGDDDPLPVTLTNFSAAYFQNEFVSVSWTTESETEMNCYNLYRSEDGSEGQFLIYSENAKNTTSTHNYEYQDHEVENGVTYQYWLEAVGNDGSTTEYGPTSVTVQGEEAPELPDATLLYGNYPNPFNPDTRIKFDIKEGETAELTIYNIRGAVVTKENFSANEENGGRITYQWDASEYSSGVYFYRLRTESYTEVKKMLMLK